MKRSSSGADTLGLPATPEIEHDLRQVDQLLAAFGRMPADAAADLDDVLWLRRQRRLLSSVLALRGTLRRRKVVSLDLWRSGGSAAARLRAQAA